MPFGGGQSRRGEVPSAIAHPRRRLSAPFSGSRLRYRAGDRARLRRPNATLGAAARAAVLAATGGCDRASAGLFRKEFLCARPNRRKPRAARETHLANDTRNLDARRAIRADCLLRYRKAAAVLHPGARLRNHAGGGSRVSRPPPL